ncbi:hypothetical protein EQ836_07635 [Ectopseudomonas mendocina]|uniref:Uncharacterized protein n=1 Tax=Ectopseudomonas mendocina TaxID=300 RepID=A0ABD7RYF1_ECTME|nr:choice-of-anchor R domain-containing protein [Pseudomonas mendocina]TRO14337.1 hypothetical protein EQ829_10030 [Pseudomonas mendocina]TRO19388.1 hypothetical protein EQ836_07635 [Pseudomonas mendocina]
MQLFLNNWSGALTAAATDSAAAMTVAPEAAALLGGITPGDHYAATLEGEAGIEIVHITATAAGELTVLRAQEGTAALFWPAGSVLEMRITAGSLEALQSSGGGGGGGAFGMPRVPLNAMVCPFELTTGGNISYLANTLYAVPFEPSYAMTIDQVGIRIQVANASASVRVALYTADENGWPNERVELAIISAASSGHQVAALDLPRELEPGRLYWLVIQPTGGSVNLVNVGARAIGMTSTGISARILRRFGASMPATWSFVPSDLDLAIDAAPFVSIRRSA